VTSHEIVAGLVVEMQAAFALLGARQALEAERSTGMRSIPLS